jgi:hypothetical protein
MALTIKAIAAVFLFAAFNVYAESNFARVQVGNGVSIELPRNWSIISDNTRITVDAAVEAQGAKVVRSNLPFAANLYNDSGRTVAILNVRFYPDNNLTQKDCRVMTEAGLAELDKVSRPSFESSLKSASITNPIFEKTVIGNISGVCVLRQSEAFDMPPDKSRFKQFRTRFWNAPNSFTVTMGYHTAAEPLVGPIVQRVIASIRVQ